MHCGSGAMQNVPVGSHEAAQRGCASACAQGIGRNRRDAAEICDPQGDSITSGRTGSYFLDLPASGTTGTVTRRLHLQRHLPVAGEDLGLWVHVWGSSAVLAGILSGFLPVVGCSVLEIGAGSGPVNVACALAGARVLATDIVPDGLRLCRCNAELNGIAAGDVNSSFSCSCEASGDPSASVIPIVDKCGAGGAREDWAGVFTAVMNWDNPVLPEPAVLRAARLPCWGGFDLVLGSDVLYMQRAAKYICRVMLLALRCGGAAVLSDPGRPSAEALEMALDEHPEELEWERVDILRVRTPLCDLPKLTLFLVRRLPVAKSVVPQDTWNAAVGWVRSHSVPPGEEFRATYHL